MSQVLIGIIGVILFIGLALAGAMFLGPRFQEASINSKTAAILTSLDQVSAAAKLYRINEGQQATNVWQLVPEYMKDVPSNPATAGSAMQLLDMLDSDGNYNPSSDGVREMIRMSLGSGDEADAICEAINIQTRGTDRLQKRFDPFNPLGCFYSGSAVGSTRYAYATF